MNEPQTADVPVMHELFLEPQPIADQWMGRCRCGWVATANLDTRDETIATLKRKFEQHVSAPVHQTLSN